MRNKTLVALAVAAAMLPLAIQPAMAQQSRPGGGPQAMFEQFDGNNDGVVTRDEVAAFRAERFQQADINGDGLLNREELATAQAQWRLDRLIGVLDTDGDGMISESELATRGTPSFAWADANGDGQVTREEAAQMRRGGYGGGRGGMGGNW